MLDPFDDNRLFVCDAYDAGFDIQPDNLIPKEEGVRNDLLLTRKNNNYDQIDKTSLFSINGLIYPSVVKDNGIYLINANHAKDNNVLIIRTNLLSEIEKIKLTPEDITNIYSIDTCKKEPIYVKTKFDLSKHFYMFVISGFLYINDKRISIVDDNLLKVKQLSLELDEKYLFSMKNIRTDNNLNIDIKNAKTIDKIKFYEFENIKRLFTANNTFLVKFDSLLKCNEFFIASHDLPGKYISNKPSNSLIISSSQKILNYRNIGNKFYHSISGQNLQSGLSRSRTTYNEQWTVTENSPPFRRDYDDVFIYDLRKNT